MASGTDDFNRSSGALAAGANWEVIHDGAGQSSGQFIIDSSRVIVVFGNTNPGVYIGDRWIGTQASSNDFYVEADMSGINNAQGVFIGVRFSTSGAGANNMDGYAAGFYPADDFFIMEITNGSEAILSCLGETPTTATGYTIRGTMEGSTLTMARNTTDILTAVDATYTSGGGALVLAAFGNTDSSANQWWDNFVISDFGAPPPTTSPTLTLVFAG